jgi:hypothetical protein
METRQSNATIARDRCLAALAGLEKTEDQRALWRAALKYNRLAKSETGAAGRETAGPSLAAQAWGSGGGRELG